MEMGLKDVLKSGKDRYWIRTPGMGDHQRMIVTQRIFDGPDCYPWRQVFAIWPVKTIGGKYVWFRKVYKRKFWAVWGTGFHMEPEVEYAELFDLL
jgi:hypothetical protein